MNGNAQTLNAISTQPLNMDKLPTELWERICGRLEDPQSVCSFRLTCRTGAYVGKKYLLNQQLVGFSQGSFDRALATTTHPQLGWLGQRTETLIIDPHDLKAFAEGAWKQRHHLKSCSHCQDSMEAVGIDPRVQYFSRQSPPIRDPRCPMPSSGLEALSQEWNNYRDEIRQSQDAELPHRMVFQEQILRLFAALPKLKHVVFAANEDLPEQLLTRSPVWFSHKQYLRYRRSLLLERNKKSAFLDFLRGLERTEIRLQSLTILDAPLSALLPDCRYSLPHSECLQSVRIKFAGPMRMREARNRQVAAIQLGDGYFCQICNITHTRHHLAESLGKATELQELTIAVKSSQERTPRKLSIIVAENHWPKLKRLSLAGFEATEGELEDFLLRHKDSLETLELCDAYLIDGTWRSLFTSIAGELPKLRRLKLYQGLWSKAEPEARKRQEYQSCRSSQQRSARGMELERRLQECLITGDHLFTDLKEVFRRAGPTREYLSGRRAREGQGSDLDPDVDRDVWDLMIER